MSVFSISAEERAFVRDVWLAVRNELPHENDADRQLINRITDAVLNVYYTKGETMAKSKGGADDKAPNTGSNSSTQRDNKASNTEKSKDPNRPHVDR